MKLPYSIATLITAVAAATALTACGRPDDNRTVGQKVDAGVASTERSAAEARADVKSATNDVKQASKDAGNAVAATARDMAITAKVKAELVKDPGLSALRIDVDTKDGRVVLNGTAPTSSARDRASTLATGIEGVGSVDNQLKVDPKG